MKKVFYGFCVFFLVGLILLPTMLSTNVVKNASLHAVESFYKGKIEIKDLNLGWLSGVHLRGVRVNDEEGKSLIECTRIDLDKPLISWLYSWHSFGNVVIQSPSLFVRPTSEQKEHGHGHQKKHEEKSSFALPVLQGSVSIQDAKIVAFTGEKPLARLSEGSVDLSLDLQHSSKGAIQANLSSNASPATPLSLTFSMDGNPLAEGKASFSLELDSVPTAFVEAVCQTVDEKAAGLVRESLGSSFSYTMKGTMSHAETELSSILTSRNLNSTIQASLVGTTFSLKEGSLFDGTMTPSLFSSLCSLLGQKDFTLLKSSTLSLVNRTSLQFDVEHKAFLAPVHLSFAVQEPLSLSIKKEPYFLACTGDMDGTPEEAHASLALSLSSPQLASTTCTLSCSKTSSSPVLSFEAQGNIQSDKTTFSLNAHLDTNEFTAQELIHINTSGSLSFANIPDPFSFTAPLQIDPTKQEILLTPTLEYQKKNIVTGDIHAKIAEKGPQSSGSLSLAQVPTALMNLVSSQHVEALLGDTISAKLDYIFQGVKEKGNHLTVKSQGDFWKADTDLSLDNCLLSLGSQGAHVEAQLAPERIKTIQAILNKKSDLSFRKPISFNGSVSLLQLSLSPLLESKEFSLSSLFNSLKLSSHFSLSEAEVVSQGNQVAHIAALSGELEVDGAKQHVQLKISPQKDDKHVSPEVKVTVNEFMGKEGPSLSNASFSGTFKVNALPLRLVDLVSPGKGALVEEVIGKTCTAEGELSSQKMEKGLLRCDVKADHASAHFDGAIKEGKLISSNHQPLHRLNLQNMLESSFSRTSIPFLLLLLTLKNRSPSSLIQRMSLSPLQTFSLSTLTIPKITVNVGKIVVKNGGALKIILALLKLGKAGRGTVKSLIYG